MLFLSAQKGGAFSRIHTHMSTTIENEIEALPRDQLISILADSADDNLLRWIVTDAIIRPIRVSFMRAFNKCDAPGCHSMALYSGNANRGGYPLRCPTHRTASDTGVPFASELERLSRGMEFA